MACSPRPGALCRITPVAPIISEEIAVKIRITFKDPDGVWECVREAAAEQIGDTPGLDKEERELLIDSRQEKISDALEKWIEYGEYVEIEFDTDAGTATVVPQKE
jgi:hypothetical protein